MFSVIEFTVEDGGGLAVVNSNWLTPRKKQVFWPPVNEQTKFNRYLKTESVNTETWILYKIRKIYYECDDLELANRKIYYECDDLELANRKLKKAEQESDVYSSDIESKQRRTVKRPARLLELSSDEDEPLIAVKKRVLSPVPLPPDVTLKPKDTNTFNIKPGIISGNIISYHLNFKNPSSGQPRPTTSTLRTHHQDNHACEYILKEIVKIKEQNKQILAILANRTVENSNLAEFPKNFPCPLPLKNLVDIEKVENVLQENPSLVEHLVSLKNDYSNSCENILKLKANSSDVTNLALGSTDDSRIVDNLGDNDTLQINLNDNSSSDFKEEIMGFSENSTTEDDGCVINHDSRIDVSSATSLDSINKNNCEKYDLTTKLRHFAIRNKVPHATLTALLHVLCPLHPELPLNAKTLLKTPSSTTFKKRLDNGEYIHFGITNYLKLFFVENTFDIDVVKISFNIDGIPLFKSSSVVFWPILGKIVNIKNIKPKPFTIGVYCGSSKPTPLSSFLEDFILELLVLLRSGLIISNKHYEIKVHSFLCDASARARFVNHFMNIHLTLK
ncbi:hypothetical protein QE152_g30975 [Popillia japonica]|uniref:Uncharacterized protein n=1 Tax=Popillia japonica TaxID=7064 RepID=A0AAW1JE29_POPJA